MRGSFTVPKYSKMTSKSNRKLTLPTYVSHTTLEASSEYKEQKTSSMKTVEWVQAPGHLQDSSYGLEYLNQVDQVLLHPQRELLEEFDALPCTEKFQIKNTLGQMMYCALQKTDYRSQPFRGHRQAFEMEIYDRSAKEVIHLSQPFMWSLYCFPWDVREMEVQAPPGVVVGFVKETSHPCGPRYLIKDAKGEAVLKITGPPLAHCCRAGWDFEILDRSCKTKLGTIAGQYFGHIQGGFGDVLSVQFPQESDLKLKALLLGASILIESQI